MNMPDYDEKDFDFTEKDIEKFLKIPEPPHMINYLCRYFTSMNKAAKILKIHVSTLCLCRQGKRTLNYDDGRHLAGVYLLAHFMEREELENHVNFQ